VLSDAVATGDVAGRLLGEPMQAVFRKTSHFHVKPRLAPEQTLEAAMPGTRAVA
jgi:hypothetical protein